MNKKSLENAFSDMDEFSKGEYITRYRSYTANEVAIQKSHNGYILNGLIHCHGRHYEFCKSD